MESDVSLSGINIGVLRPGIKIGEVCYNYVRRGQNSICGIRAVVAFNEQYVPVRCLPWQKSDTCAI